MTDNLRLEWPQFEELGEGENQYDIVFWNGFERVPLAVEAIDHEAGAVVLNDSRLYKF